MTGTGPRRPRLGAALDVTVEAGGTQWRGRIVDLTPDAMKVRWPDEPAQLKAGANVRLRLALPDREFPFWVTASVARASPESAVLWFVDPEDEQSRRLRDLVSSLLQREWQQVLDELVVLTPPPPKPEPVAKQAPPTPAAETQEGKSEDLLAQAGLGGLRFPRGELSRPWKEFLKGLRGKPRPTGEPPSKKWPRQKDE